MANVVMLPKSHPSTSIEKDLRSISFTPTLSKILETFVGGWMLNEISSKFDDHQCGAVQGRSITHELVNILHICHQAADNQRMTRAAFVDFAKAFDHVDHQIVLNKMAALGVQPFIIRWMHSFLLECRQRLKINIIACNCDGQHWMAECLKAHGLAHTSFWLLKIYRQYCLRSNALTTSPWLKIYSITGSQMQTSVDEIVKWSTDNHMKIN